MIELLIFIIIVLLFWLFIYLPIMGFAYLFLGEYANALLYLLPLLCLIAALLYRLFVIEPEHIRMAALSRMYNYPQRLGKRNTDNHWHSGFKEVIHNSIASISDPDKETDLNHCRQLVDKMEKLCVFENLHRSFRLTGCHLEIKDSEGHIVKQIV